MTSSSAVAHHGPLPLFDDVFGVDAVVEELVVWDATLMLGIVDGSAGRRAVLAVDETRAGSLIYAAVDLADETSGDVADPATLRRLLQDPGRQVWVLVSTSFGVVHVSRRAVPVPDSWLPGATA